MRSAILSLAFTVAMLIRAIPHHTSHIIHERRLFTSSQWVKRDRIHPETILPIRIGLTQSNLDKGHDALMELSYPDSPNYAKHWTSDQVNEFFAPGEKTVSTVKEWLVLSGIAAKCITHTDNQGWLAFDATVKEAEDLLHTEYHAYEHASHGSTVTACDQYHVPRHIQEHIDYITPGIKLLVPIKRGHVKRGIGITATGGKPAPLKRRPYTGSKSSLNDLNKCDVAITSNCIKALYQVPPGFTAHPANSMGIFEEADYYGQEDLDLFFRNFSPSIPQGTHPVPAFINSAEAPTSVANAGGESDLDLQLAYPLIYPQTITLYQTDDIFYALDADGSSSVGTFNSFLDALDGSYCTYSAFGETGGDPNLDPTYPDPEPGEYNGKLQCGVYKPTNVISISYGRQESDVPVYYQRRQCNEYLKLGLQGHSIFFASGDDGVAGPTGDDSPNGCLGLNDTIFNPAFPNSCPYVTNVGATKVYPGRTVYEPESAAVDPLNDPYSIAYSSGGGFSNIYGIPSYQAAALKDFFTHHAPPYPYYCGNETFGAHGGLYNREGRGFPDVAANGDNIAVYNQGEFMTFGGTSASAPIFAAIVNRINEARLGIGKKPVGFINPVLYSHPEILNDITHGTNPGCGTVGFSAVKGWDPVTGLGTLNFRKMLDLWLKLP